MNGDSGTIRPMKRMSLLLAATATTFAAPAALGAVSVQAKSVQAKSVQAKSVKAAFAPAATATIHPGVMTFTAGAQCTANFLFQSGATVYIGQAAHCSGTGAATDTNGCTAASLPIGTPVEVTGASKPGVLVYNSWLTMQARHETDPDTCSYNDFALVQLDPSDVAKANPSVPFWGGPVSLGGPTSLASKVYSYGNSELRLGVSTLSPKIGVSIGDSGGGRVHTVYTLSPGIPGDSGSGFMDANGRAIGVLSTIAIAPLAASNNVADLAKALDYLHAFGGSGATLVTGDQPFRALGPLG